ncbi:MAG TPA: GNAT family protein [Aquabacterium sp.]|nr:GNAT family protein [Aquabacterium sp.]
MLLLQRLLQVLIQVGACQEARVWVQRGAALWSSEREQPTWFKDMAWCLQEAWWSSLTGPSVALKRLQGADAAWLKDLFADEDFSAWVNRDYGERIRHSSLDTIAGQLALQWGQAPAHLGAQVYRIERHDGRPLGLTSLVGIDVPSRRAEFIIGLADDQATHAQAIETGTLLLDWAFRVIELHKVFVTVYSDNPRLPALKRILCSLGFQEEGCQRQHLRLQTGAYVDLHLLGAIRGEVHANPLARRLLQRYAKQDGEGVHAPAIIAP